MQEMFMKKDGLCPTIRANSGGNTQPMVIVPDPAGDSCPYSLEVANETYYCGESRKESRKPIGQNCGRTNRAEIRDKSRWNK